MPAIGWLVRRLSRCGLAIGLAALAVVRAAEPAPDFHLQNVNERSNRGLGPVSPRDYLYQVAGYYFGTAG